MLLYYIILFFIKLYISYAYKNISYVTFWGSSQVNFSSFKHISYIFLNYIHTHIIRFMIFIYMEKKSKYLNL